MSKIKKYLDFAGSVLGFSNASSDLSESDLSAIKRVLSKYNLSTRLERRLYRHHDSVRFYSHFVPMDRVKDNLLKDLSNIGFKVRFENNGDGGGIKVYIFKSN